MMNEYQKPVHRVLYIEHDEVAATTMKWVTLRAWWSPTIPPRNLILIDETFCVYNICGTIRPKPKPGWWNRIKWLLSPIYHVDLIFDGPPRQSTLEECRELIYKAMELDPEHHESSRTMEEWKDDLWSAQTFEELCILIRCEPREYARFLELKKSRQ
jgi:hypothetical protein